MAYKEVEIGVKIKVDDRDAKQKLGAVQQQAEDIGTPGGGSAPQGPRQGSYKPPPMPSAGFTGRTNRPPPPAPPPIPGTLAEKLSARYGERSQGFFRAPEEFMTGRGKFFGGLDAKERQAVSRYTKFANKHGVGGFMPEGFEPIVDWSAQDKAEARARKAAEQDASRQARQAATEAAQMQREEERRAARAVADAEREQRKADVDDERSSAKTSRDLRKGGGRVMDVAKGVIFGSMAVGLGSSIEGFFLNTADWAKEYSKGLKQIQAQYGDIADLLMSIGHRQGFVAQQSFETATAIGTQTNRINATQVQGALSFSRAFGYEPGMIGQVGGRLSRLFGQNMTGAELTGARSLAGRYGMDAGRFPEFLQSYLGNAEGAFARTGQTGTALRRQAGFETALPGMIFGFGTERSVGASADRFMSGLQGLGQGEAMSTFLMRAMNYGGKDGPDFMDAMLRKEAGLSDPKNLSAFARYAKQTFGNDPKRLFSILMPHAQEAGMPMWGLAALTNTIGSGSLDNLDPLDYGLKGTMTDKQVADRAQDMIGAGSTFDVAMEGRRSKYGSDMLSAVTSLGSAADKFISIIEAFTGEKISETVKRAASNIEVLAEETAAAAVRIKEATRDIANPIDATNRNQSRVLDQLEMRRELERRQATEGGGGTFGSGY